MDFIFDLLKETEKGSENDFHFFIVSNSGEFQLPEMKKYCSQPKLLHSEISKIHIFTLHVRNKIAIPKKSSYSF